MGVENREARIKARAHEIWQRNGSLEGTHQADWFQAAREIDAEMGEDAAPAHPTMSGGSLTSETVLPDPFADRRSDASTLDAQKSGPEPAGKSKAPKSL
jgi:hypothetical protein